MKNYYFSIFLAIYALVSIVDSNVFAQENATRFMTQHNSRFIKAHLKQTEEMLITALQSSSINMESSAVQTLRELEQLFPYETFSSFIEPLSEIVKNEKSDINLRILSALALDGIHNNKGDQVIYEMAKNTSNESFKYICTALSIESFKSEDEIATK